MNRQYIRETAIEIGYLAKESTAIGLGLINQYGGLKIAQLISNSGDDMDLFGRLASAAFSFACFASGSIAMATGFKEFVDRTIQRVTPRRESPNIATTLNAIPTRN